MGLTGFSFLLVSSSSRHTAKSLIHSPFLFSAPKFSSPLIRKTQNFSFNGGQRFLSTVLQPETDLERSPGSRKTLSDRMSFVFDQLDMIESEKSGKDEALQQIRAWREQKSKTLSDKGVSGIVVSKTRDEVESTKNGDFFKQQAQVEVIHPWPEWIEFMERLLQQNYFDLRRRNEDCNAPVDALGFTEEGVDFTRDWTTVRTACLNFGRDRFDILRSLSRKDIQILVGHGCPSVDTKVVVSAKVLRKHVHLDEGDVCSSCSLRGSCDRAYLLTRKEDEARTLDVVRVLLTYGFDPLNGTVENKSLLKLKSVKSVVRKLLHEVVKLSAVPIDPNLPPPVIKKPPPKVKQPPPPPKKRVGRDDIEMKKGDWLCPKCDFMNFAKNTICLQCDANRPKRQLLPGEWECPKCNFLNYRRNMACFHCDHKRPPDEFVENQLQPRPHGPRTNLRRVADIPSISNAWNFDFDDNESDGADVAAFEYADPSRTDGSSDGQANRGSSRHFEDDPFETAQMQSIHERGKYSEPDRRKPSSAGPGTGFDDFDDEDDIDSYELDVTSNNSAQEASPTSPSRARGFSKSDDFDDSDDYSNSRRGIDSHSYSNSEDADRDFDSDNELREWKSSHVSDLRPLHGSRGRSGPYRGISFGLEDELVLDSDSDNDIDQGIKYKPNNGGKKGLNRKGNRRGRSSDGSEDGFLSDSESDDEGKRKSHRSMLGRDRAGPDRRGNTFSSGMAQEARFRSNDRRSDKRNCFGNGGHGGSFRASRASNSRGEGWNSRGAQRSGHGWSMNDTRGGLRDLDRPGHGEGFGYRQRGNRKEFNDRSGSVRGFGDNRQHQHRR